MDFSYIHRNVTDDEMNSSQIPTFAAPGVIEHPQSGFNLNYGELAANLQIDFNFEIFFDFLFTKNDFEIDEIYANTINIPYGFGFKVGRFLSAFGWHNRFHKHQWDFSDAPLIQTVFFGERGLLEDAIQASWTVPVDFYMLIGIEIAKGENSNSFGSDSFGHPDLGVRKSKGPNLYLFFIDSNVNISSLLINWGLRVAGGQARIKGDLQTNSGAGIYGATVIGGAHIGFKYNFDRFTYIEWQNEVILRNIKGDIFVGEQNEPVPLKYDVSKNQIGMYSQLILKPLEYWRFGIRGEILTGNDEIDLADKISSGTLIKYSAMTDFNPSEYSQIRLQLNYNKEFHNIDDKPLDVLEVILQFNFAFGSHGAHLI
ncbi:MAG: hypothetical protein FWG49_00105 [Leptospirales bacterium]|nr:hypothetical protein [Leptospirales bacterium]